MYVVMVTLAAVCKSVAARQTVSSHLTMYVVMVTLAAVCKSVAERQTVSVT